MIISSNFFLHFSLEKPHADHILAENLKRRGLSSAAPIQTIQPVGDRQNTRLSFSCSTKRHPVTFTKLFTRTDESSRNIRCPIRCMLSRAKMWEEMRRVPFPISKHSETVILWTNQSLSKKNTTPLQIPPQMGKRYAIWRRSRIGSALVRVRQPICSKRSAMATYLFHWSVL